MEIEDKYILDAKDYAIMQALTHLYGMYETQGNTTLKESIRAKAVSIRQQTKYSGKYSLSDKQGTYLDNYQYTSDYHYNASKYIDAEYITKERIWIYGGKAQTWPQMIYEDIKQLTLIGKLRTAKSASEIIKMVFIGDNPSDFLDNVDKYASISNVYNIVGRNLQKGDVKIRAGSSYKGTNYWFRENILWHEEPYDNSLYY